MIIAYWIVAGLAALAFIAVGSMKIARPKDKLVSAMPWTEDFAPAAIKLIGTAEVVGAVGLIAPILLNIAPVLSPIASAALFVLMLGAIGTHIRRKEQFAPPLVLATLAAAAAVLGFLSLA